MSITIQELAVHRGIVSAVADPAIYPGSEYLRVGLPIMAGCESCHASLAPVNAYPSRSGYIRCADCIGNLGYETVEAANADIFDDEHVTDAEADAIRRLQTELGAEIVEDD